MNTPTATGQEWPKERPDPMRTIDRLRSFGARHDKKSQTMSGLLNDAADLLEMVYGRQQKLGALRPPAQETLQTDSAHHVADRNLVGDGIGVGATSSPSGSRAR